MGVYVKRLDYTLKPEDCKKLRNFLFATMKKEMLDEKYSKRMVAGLFTGLRHMQEIIRFEDVHQINDLYEILKRLTSEALKSSIKISSRGEKFSLFIDF